MAVVNQLNLNVGTEQSPNFVLHDINDKRISTTAVTTATHLLTCNSGVTSIAPITAANLASVLGGVIDHGTVAEMLKNVDLDDYTERGGWVGNGTNTNQPVANVGILLVICNIGGRIIQVYIDISDSIAANIYYRFKPQSTAWKAWRQISTTSL